MVAACVYSCSNSDGPTADDAEITVRSIVPTQVAQGGTLRITGTNLKSVTTVIFHDGVAVREFLSKTDTEIAVTVPEDAASGQLRLVHSKGEIVPRFTVIIDETTIVKSVSPTSGLLAGDRITVNGRHLDDITAITFADNVAVSATDFITQSPTEITVEVPKSAVGGKISFSYGSGAAKSIIEYATPLDIKTAIYGKLDNQIAGSAEQIVIIGENLQLVETVIFPDNENAEFTVSTDGTQLSATVPDDTHSGNITLRQYSGKEISTGTFTYPTITYSGLSPSVAVKGGGTLTIAGTNLDRVRQLELPNGTALKPADFTVSDAGGKLSIAVPDNMTDGKLRLIQNRYISIDTDPVTVSKSGDSGKGEEGDNPDAPATVWEGAVTFDGSWGCTVKISAEKFSALKTGSKIQFHYTTNANSTYWQIKPMDSDWNSLSYNKKIDQMYGNIPLSKSSTSISVSLSASDITALQTGGMVLSGCWITLTKVAIVK